MSLYQAIKLLHQGLIHKDPLWQNMFLQNTYYIIPIVNVDGVAQIEEVYQKTGEFIHKRKNNNPKALKSSASGKTCDLADQGVDLNRNYGVDWGLGSLAQVEPKINSIKKTDTDECKDTCSECFRGDAPFSEPETQAIKAFFEENSKNIKFVMNFHSYGNMWIIPFNGRKYNDIEKRKPGVLEIF